MASMKYQPTYSMIKDIQKTSYTPHTPIKPPPYAKSPRDYENGGVSYNQEGLRKVDTKYLKLPLPSMALPSTTVSAPHSDNMTSLRQRNRNMIMSDTEAIAEELDDLLLQFQYKV